MPLKKFPQIAVHQDTWRELQNMKFQLRTESFDELIRILIREHGVKK